MSDDLKNAAIAIFSLALFSGFATHRAEHAIVHDLRNTLRGGQLHADVRPHGLFGLVLGRFDTVRVTGSDLSADSVPFRILRGAGIRAHVSRLEFDLHNLTLRGTTVRRFTADFPAVSLDAGRALFDERIIIRRSGEGRASAEVSAEALAGFIVRKYPGLRQVKVTLTGGKATVAGAATVLGTVQQIEATGRLVTREGRYIDLVEPAAILNGKPAAPAFAANLARQVNPVVDFDNDLGLGDIFYAETVEIGEGAAVVTGRAFVPPSEGQKEKKP
jgi:hypothetical protein